MEDRRHFILEQFKKGDLSEEEVLNLWQQNSFADMGFAKIDLHRESRCGFPEVV